MNIYIDQHQHPPMGLELQDLPVSWPTLTVNPKSLDATTPLAPAKGRGRGRGRGTVKGTGKGEETQPLPKAKTQKKTTTMSLLSSLVRTGNQMSNAGSWQIVLKQVNKLMAERLVLHSSNDLAGDCAGRLAINRSILVMLGKLNQDSVGAPSSVPVSLQNSSQELLEFLDNGCTTAVLIGSDGMYWLCELAHSLERNLFAQ